MLNTFYEPMNQMEQKWMACLNLKYEFIAFILIFELIWNSYVYLYDSSRFTILLKSKIVFILVFRFGNLFGQMMMRLLATGFDLPHVSRISCGVHSNSQEFHKCNNLAAILKFNGVRCSMLIHDRIQIGSSYMNTFLFDLFLTFFRLFFLLILFFLRFEWIQWKFCYFFSSLSETNRNFFARIKSCKWNGIPNHMLGHSTNSYEL